MAKLYTALLTLSFIWGLSFVFIKWLSEFGGVWGTVFIRCLAGALIMLPLLYIKRKEIIKPIPWKSLIIVGVLNCGLPWGLIALSETTINSSTAAVLNALTPICTGLIGFAFFSTVLSKRQWIGIIIGFVGILVLMGGQIKALHGFHIVGVGTMLAATICYGSASQYTKHFLNGASIVLITAVSLLTGALIGLFGMIFSGSDIMVHAISKEVIFATVGLGCFGSGIATLLYFYIMKKAGPEFASTVTYIVPASAMIWGYVLLGETISLNLIIGLLIIFIGIVLTTKKNKKVTEQIAA
ncbi:DMT family transporter [Falsibacillus pallidus]|uniref:Threonine/homoserine efflux transporter RhtA n=1 Tax=Falsibacillus pallidus TaxID=493781 RepID=A0A370GSF1_9BACI|nr:DMT family transporter [Falsibacillus pallidus]RDI45434.1 threonine/homoserine efflux transporter RhtA [Falsibacillus pallidus]